MNTFKNRTEYPNIPLGYMGEKLQIIYLIRHLYLDYINNSVI